MTGDTTAKSGGGVLYGSVVRRSSSAVLLPLEAKQKDCILIWLCYFSNSPPEEQSSAGGDSVGNSTDPTNVFYNRKYGWAKVYRGGDTDEVEITAETLHEASGNVWLQLSTPGIFWSSFGSFEDMYHFVAYDVN